MAARCPAGPEPITMRSKVCTLNQFSAQLWGVAPKPHHSRMSIESKQEHPGKFYLASFIRVYC
jgi:hypothetical protein